MVTPFSTALCPASHTFSPWITTTLTLGQNLNATNFKQVYATGSSLV